MSNKKSEIKNTPSADSARDIYEQLKNDFVSEKAEEIVERAWLVLSLFELNGLIERLISELGIELDDKQKALLQDNKVMLPDHFKTVLAKSVVNSLRPVSYMRYDKKETNDPNLPF